MFYLDNTQERTKRITLLDSLSIETVKFSSNVFGEKCIVMAEGNVLSNCLILGEALDKEEQIKKRIFIGPSGQILRHMFKTLDIEESIMIANIIPWRLRENKTPSQYEIKTMSFFIKELIKIISPEYIFCFGSVARDFFKITTNKKAQLNAELYYTNHPAFYIRSNMQLIIEDIFQTILKIGKVINDVPKDFYVFKQELQYSL